jgi:hypothetical protein
MELEQKLEAPAAVVHNVHIPSRLSGSRPSVTCGVNVSICWV